MKVDKWIICLLAVFILIQVALLRCDAIAEDGVAYYMDRGEYIKIYHTRQVVTEELVGFIEDVPGVDEANALKKYGLYVEIGCAFKWDEVEPKVLKIIGAENLRPLNSFDEPDPVREGV